MLVDNFKQVEYFFRLQLRAISSCLMSPSPIQQDPSNLYWRVRQQQIINKGMALTESLVMVV